MHLHVHDGPQSSCSPTVCLKPVCSLQRRAYAREGAPGPGQVALEPRECQRYGHAEDLERPLLRVLALGQGSCPGTGRLAPCFCPAAAYACGHNYLHLTWNCGMRSTSSVQNLSVTESHRLSGGVAGRPCGSSVSGSDSALSGRGTHILHGVLPRAARGVVRH